MIASEHIEAFAREPFPVGHVDDDPREAAQRMGWTGIGWGPQTASGRWFAAWAPGGREMRVYRSGSGCVAREVGR